MDVPAIVATVRQKFELPAPDHDRGEEAGSGTGPILLSQATFLLAHTANSGPDPLPGP